MEEIKNIIKQLSDCSVASVSVKPPKFYEDDVETWFIIMENQFAVAKITSEQTKLNHIIANLPPGIHNGKVKQLLRKTFENGAYGELRKALIDHYSESKAKRLQSILETEEIGDRKPSAFYYFLQCKAEGIDVSEEVLRNRWLNKLPSDVQTILTSLKDILEMDKLLSTADEVYEMCKSRTSYATDVSAVGKSRSHSPSEPRNRSRRARSRNRNRSPDRGSQSELCYFHRKFGEKAYRCEKPCNFVAKNELQ